MKNFDKIYLSKFSADPDSGFSDVEDFIDFDFGNDSETYQFLDEDINELEDLLWN